MKRSSGCLIAQRQGTMVPALRKRETRGQGTVQSLRGHSAVGRLAGSWRRAREFQVVELGTWKSSLTYRCTYRRCSWPRRCLCPDKVAHHGWVAARRSFSSSCGCNRSRTPTMRTIWTIRHPRLAKRRWRRRVEISFRSESPRRLEDNRPIDRGRKERLHETKRPRNSRALRSRCGRACLSIRSRLLTPLARRLSLPLLFPFSHN